MPVPWSIWGWLNYVLRQGCGLGHESSRQTLVKHQYLDPAWYHLWRLFPKMYFGDKSATLFEDHPMTGKRLIPRVCKSPVPFQMAFLWLTNGGDSNYLLNWMILQVESFCKKWLNPGMFHVSPS